MPAFNIHWKGCPHRHLPHVRTASTPRSSIRGESIARVAAEEVVRSPLSAALEQERKKQLLKLRRRRASRLSRGSSAVLRSRKRASQRAGQHIQVFGWNTDIASRLNTDYTASQPTYITARADSRSGDTVTRGTVIDSNDGAAASNLTKPGKPRPQSIYSLMHVAEAPVFWNSEKSTSRRRASATASPITGASKRVRGYAHVGSLDSVCRRSIYCGPQTLGRSRTYDPRIDPSATEKPRRPTTYKIFQTKPTAASRLLETKGHSQSSGRPEVWETVNPLEQEEGRGATRSTKSTVDSIVADSLSRTTSQRRTLQQFTRELEIYLQAAKTLPKQSIVSSTSSTTVSAYTIQALKPYRAEFQSAGLAVTSADQRRITERISHIPKELAPPPTPPKDKMATPRKSLFGKPKTASTAEKKVTKRKTPSSELSYSDGTDVIAFTPPHEKSECRDKHHKSGPSRSSDLTVLGFTPPDEKVSSRRPPTAAPASMSPPKTPSKKPLPWLRKQDFPPEVPPSAAKSIYASSKEIEDLSPIGE